MLDGMWMCSASDLAADQFDFVTDLKLTLPFIL